ncbi:hypothetical protein P152DRAFT_456115 [Eremomyces bilateralis CBS 781.70]|uniref:Uncharacterized protein n=1 Tax=Eremomyces bilateralis CBS 781.70 TaxID=1392243 RepID=A0A6G1GAG9_9PEZI|nr:uncharacterized protein P152DRAFT_456115 [Eremomyces bilateralis CBS 781.70]KAF1815078.1 hypothetical protein P152DRAFT_456115 [Eremomyces bilateralis CBS 781.70]
MAESQARAARQRGNKRVLRSEMGYITSQQARSMIKVRTEREKQAELDKWVRGWKPRQINHRKAFKDIHVEFWRLIGGMRHDPTWRCRFGDE